MEGDPNTSDEHILEQTVEGLNEVNSMELKQVALLAQSAPKFTNTEEVLLSILMVAKPLRLTYQHVLTAISSVNEGKSTAVEDSQIVGAVKQLIDQGLVEQRGSDANEFSLAITEIGEIIFKMWALAGKLLEEHEIKKI